MTQFQKGCSPWNKGVFGYSTSFKGGKFSEETKKRQLEGRIKNGLYKRWSEKYSGENSISKRPEVREKMRLVKLGTHRSEETKLKISKGMIGKNWKPAMFHAKKNERNDAGYLFWVREIKKRDKNTCAFKNEECRGYNIVHHILPWRDYPEERYNIKNGVTLCQHHHPRRRPEERIMILPLQQIISQKYV
jgi:hypothetical protein